MSNGDWCPDLHGSIRAAASTEVLRDGRADRLARYLARMPDKQSSAHIVVKSFEKRTTYLERALDSGLFLNKSRRAANGAQPAYQKIVEQAGVEEAQSYFGEGCPHGQLAFKPYQQARARLFTGAGGLGLPSTRVRRLSALIGSGVRILPEVRADLTGPLEDKVTRELPKPSITALLGSSLRENRDTRRVTKEMMAGIDPKSWLDWGLGAEKEVIPRLPEADILATHDAATTHSRKA